MTAKRFAPATTRNREPILEVLARVLPPAGLVLEIASGTGEHAAFFATHLSHLDWQPSDAAPALLASIAAWREECAARNFLPPIELDVTREPWPVTDAAAIVCINMVHISPWPATLALLRGAGRILPAGGVLYLYGAYRVGGKHTAPSNESFDLDLRARNPSWGVRDFEAVVAAAAEHELSFVERIAMPANNLSLVFHRS